MHVCVHRESGSVHGCTNFTKLSGSVATSVVLTVKILEIGTIVLPRQFGYKFAKSTLLYTVQLAYYEN